MLTEILSIAMIVIGPVGNIEPFSWPLLINSLVIAGPAWHIGIF